MTAVVVDMSTTLGMPFQGIVTITPVAEGTSPISQAQDTPY